VFHLKKQDKAKNKQRYKKQTSKHITYKQQLKKQNKIKNQKD
jgi:hypothetical protein